MLKIRNSLACLYTCIRFFLLLIPFSAGAEPVVWYVFLKDKGPDALPVEAFSAKEYQGLEVYQPYAESVSGYAVRMRNVSRWLNAISIEAEPEVASSIGQLPFVDRVEPLLGTAIPQQISHKPADNGRLDTLVSLVRAQMGQQYLEEAGLTGKGVTIAILDAGFKYANIHPAFDSLRLKNGIVATHDFFDKQTNVYHHSDHGTLVLNCLAGKYGDRNIGLAPDAHYLLARVEHERWEKAVEEDYWIAALEWADSLGAQIVSSSVTFMRPRYTYADMNGYTSPVSRVAAMAVSRGILVVCAMGNEGEKRWHFMGAPADSPTVLSVGGTMPMPAMRIKFSSLGPNSVGHPKPDVAAPAFVAAPKGADGWSEAAGTSFSTPLVAGFAACLLQQNPGLRTGDLFQAVRMAGNRFPYYDYELGYGVPNGQKALHLLPEVDTLFRVGFRNDTVVVVLDSARFDADPFARDYGQVLAYHLEKRPGILLAHYNTILNEDAKYYYFLLTPGTQGLLRIWMGGYLWQQKLTGEETQAQ